MNDEILRLVDTIHRSKEIEKEIIFAGIEAALLSAVKKKYGESETARVHIDRRTGETRAFDGENEIAIEDLGRLAALSGKQVLFQKIREAERDRIYEEFEEKVRTLVVGTVQRQEGVNLIVNLGKVEGFLPRGEQVPGEKFKVGDRIKVLIKDLKKNTNRVKVTLSRSSPDLVRALFELEVPEIAERVIEIKGIAREAGYRTKIAVSTNDPNVDCVGACVGVRGSRIKNIVDELFGEKIDIVRWSDSIEVLIVNALRPAEISSIDLDFEDQRAVIYVRPDQQSLAIGKRGQNVRLASKLTGWALDIQAVTEEDLEKLRRENVAVDESGIHELEEESTGDGEEDFTGEDIDAIVGEEGFDAEEFDDAEASDEADDADGANETDETDEDDEDEDDGVSAADVEDSADLANELEDSDENADETDEHDSRQRGDVAGESETRETELVSDDASSPRPLANEDDDLS